MPAVRKLRKPDIKVVILGDMNVGKTSLLHRYTERCFKDTLSTVGGAFFLKQWGPYNISIWDTAGGFLYPEILWCILVMELLESYNREWFGWKVVVTCHTARLKRCIKQNLTFERRRLKTKTSRKIFRLCT